MLTNLFHVFREFGIRLGNGPVLGIDANRNPEDG